MFVFFFSFFLFPKAMGETADGMEVPRLIMSEGDGIMRFIFNPIFSVLDDPITHASERARMMKQRLDMQICTEEKRRQMHNIRCLDLTNGKLLREPFEPEQLTSLTSLRLGSNGIKGIHPSTFQTLTSLTYLEMNNNEMTQVVEELGCLTALTALLIHNNNLCSLPASLATLTNLTTLTLASNNLTYPPPRQPGLPPSFPDAWCERLDGLTALDMSRNRLAQLPPGIWRLRGVRRLIFDRNSLESVEEVGAPVGEGCAASLEALSLHANRLTHLPHSLTRLSALKTLIVSDNMLESLPDTSKIPTLTLLDARRNRLTRRGLVGFSTALLRLNLSHNSMQVLPSDILRGLKELEEVDLSHNKLAEAPASLGSLSALTCLRLAHNELEHLDFLERDKRRGPATADATADATAEPRSPHLARSGTAVSLGAL